MGLTIVSTESELPVTLDWVREYLHGYPITQQAVCEDMIRAAEQHVSDIFNQFITYRTIDETFDAFPAGREPLIVGRAPMAWDSPNTYVKYIDTDGTLQTLGTSLYTVDTANRPGRIYPAYSEIWPTTREIENAVTVRFKAGYATAAAIPSIHKLAIAKFAAQLYRDRETSTTGTIVTPDPAMTAIIAAQRDWGAF